jgi:hypothetical protein
MLNGHGKSAMNHRLESTAIALALVWCAIALWSVL